MASEVDQPALCYGSECSAPLASARVHRKQGSTYEGIVSATDGLLGARSTSSRTDGGDRVAAEPEETVDSGKGDPEQSAEVVERCGVRLQRGPVSTASESMRRGKISQSGS